MNSLGERICAVGILRYIFCSIFVVVFFRFRIYKLLIVDNFLTGVFGEFCSLRRTWSLCLGAFRLDFLRADLGIRTDTFKLVFLYIEVIIPF